MAEISIFSDEQLILWQGTIGYDGYHVSKEELAELCHKEGVELKDYYYVPNSNLQYMIIEDRHTKQIAIIFQGSTGGIDTIFEGGDWSENFLNLLGEKVPQYHQLEKVMKELLNEYGDRITAVTGNSLGGGLVIVAAKYLPNTVKLIAVNPAPPDKMLGPSSHPNLTIVIGSTDLLSQIVMSDLSRLPISFQKDYYQLEEDFKNNILTISDFNLKLETLRQKHKISQQDIYGGELFIVERSIGYQLDYGLELAHVGSVAVPEKVMAKFINSNGKEIKNKAAFHLTKLDNRILSFLWNKYNSPAKLTRTEEKRLYQLLYYGLTELEKKEVDQARLALNLSSFMGFDLFTRNMINISTGELVNNGNYTFEINSLEDMTAVLDNLRREKEEYIDTVIKYNFGNISLKIDLELEEYRTVKEKLKWSILDSIWNLLHPIQEIRIQLFNFSSCTPAVKIEIDNLLNYIGLKCLDFFSLGITNETSAIFNDLKICLEKGLEEYGFDQITKIEDGLRYSLKNFQTLLAKQINSLANNIDILANRILNVYKYIYEMENIIIKPKDLPEYSEGLNYLPIDYTELENCNYPAVYNCNLTNVVESVIVDKLEEFRLRSQNSFFIIENRLKQIIDGVLAALSISISGLELTEKQIRFNMESLLYYCGQLNFERKDSIELYNNQIKEIEIRLEEQKSIESVLLRVKTELNFNYLISELIYQFKEELAGLLLSNTLIFISFTNYCQAIESTYQLLGVIKNLKKYVEQNCQGNYLMYLLDIIKQIENNLFLIITEIERIVGKTNSK